MQPFLSGFVPIFYFPSGTKLSKTLNTSKKLLSHWIKIGTAVSLILLHIFVKYFLSRTQTSILFRPRLHRVLIVNTNWITTNRRIFGSGDTNSCVPDGNAIVRSYLLRDTNYIHQNEVILHGSNGVQCSEWNSWYIILNNVLFRLQMLNKEIMQKISTLRFTLTTYVCRNSILTLAEIYFWKFYGICNTLTRPPVYTLANSTSGLGYLITSMWKTACNYLPMSEL